MFIVLSFYGIVCLCVCVCVCECISPHNVVQHCSHTETYTKHDWQVEKGEEEPRQLVCCGQLTPPLGWDGGTRVGTEGH